jgi:succinoglycan biosynthesis transport protein ExoP
LHSDRSTNQEIAVIQRKGAPSVGPLLPIEHKRHIEETLPVSHYLMVLSRQKWRIALFTLLCGLVALFVSLRETPLYQSVALIDVDRNGDLEAVGSDPRNATPGNPEQFIATQMRLIQSDAVLRPVAQKHNLPLEQQDAWFAPKRSDEASARNLAPAVLKHLKVTHPPQTYLIYIQYRSPDPHLAAQVANEIAQSYIDHVFRIRYESSQTLSSFMERQLDELRGKMEHSNAALSAFERELNMIDPEERTSIISSRLLQLNAEFTLAQADRVKKEAAFCALSQGSMEAAAISEHGDRLQDLEKRQQELLANFAKIKQHYGPNHPAYVSAQAELEQVQAARSEATARVQRQIGLGFEEAVQREKLLDKELRATKAEFDRLNARSFQYKTLKREADADRKLYEELAAKTKQATINAGFPSTAIRIADLARPAYAPVTPNIKLNVIFTMVLGLLVSVGVALLADMLDTTVRDPQVVSAVLGSEVLGMLPRIRGRQGHLIPSMLLNSGGASMSLTRSGDSTHRSIVEYQESIKTLHASLLLSGMDQRLRTIMITSASPSEGKSTVATTIAMSHASSGKKVLLIDGDLRRPSIADKLSISRRHGLVDVCLHGVSWRDMIHTMEQLPNLDVLPTGSCNRRAIDHFPSLLSDLLADASAEYDLVIVDSPPILGFPEPLHMASLVDGVLVVALAGSTDRKALHQAMNQLRRIGAQTLGVVMNGSTRDSQSGYYYHHYSSHYAFPKPTADDSGDRQQDRVVFDENTNKTLAS